MSISQMMQTGAGSATASGSLTDQVAATGLLTNAKAGAKAATAMTIESATPEVRQTFQRFLQDYLRVQEELTNLMMKRGWYHPFESPEQQIRHDLQYASRANLLH